MSSPRLQRSGREHAAPCLPCARLDPILISDVEATCWKGPIRPGEANEIIEIGACLLDVATGRRWDGRSLLVRPERSCARVVSPFRTERTTLTQEQVDTGLSSADARPVPVERTASRNRVWASYGEYDRPEFHPGHG